METQRPVVIGFDQTPASERAVAEAAALLGSRPAIVVVVWEAGLAFQAASTPALEAWSVAADISQSFAGDEAMHDAAMQVAERGAGLAEAAGMPATSVTVADETTVAQTLIRVAQERDAVAIAVGAHSRRGAHRLGLGSTSKELVEHAPCPVIVVREPAAL